MKAACLAKRSMRYVLVAIVSCALAIWGVLPVGQAYAANAQNESVADAAARSEIDVPAVMDARGQEQTLVGSRDAVPAAPFTLQNTEAQSAGAQDQGPMLSIMAANSCGADATWSFSSGTLTISGKGAVSDSSGFNSIKSQVTKIDIKSGITEIGKNVFSNCKALVSVNIPKTVKTIASGAFFGCSSLASISLPSTVTVLSEGVFADCESLSSVSMPGVTEIQDYALQNVDFKTFEIPAKVTSFSHIAFMGCDIEAYSVQSGNSKYSAKDGVLYADKGKTLYCYPKAKTATKFDIPSGVTKLGQSCCQGAQNIEVLTVPDTVKTAEYFCFCSMPNLRSIKFGKGLKSTSYQMLKECESLESIDFGGLQELDAHTFAYCYSLKEVELPATIKKIGNGSFGQCSNLTTFKSAAIEEIPFQTFLNDRNLTSVTLNKGLKAIYRASFLGCYSLKSITIPATCTFIGLDSFNDVTKVKLQNSKMKKFGTNGYRYLQEVKLSGKELYGYAFDVLTLVNKERKKKGAPALKMNASLMETAMQRAAETALLFSHTRPDSSQCFSANTLMRAENIAAGQTTPASVMTSWINSSGHYQNIIDTDNTTIGIGCFLHNGVYYWVQCFGSGNDKTNCAKPADKSKSHKVMMVPEEFETSMGGSNTSFSFGGTTEKWKFKPAIHASSSSLAVGATQKLSIICPNAGGSFTAKLDNYGITWSSSNSKIASLSGTTLKGAANGKAKITAKMEHYDLSRSFTIGTGVASAANAAAKTVKAGGATYKTTSSSTVAYTKAPSNATSVTVPATIKIGGKTYKVTSVSSAAFKGSKSLKTITIGKNVSKIAAKAFPKAYMPKLRTLILKTTKLTTKASMKNCLAGSAITKVKVSVGTAKTNKTYIAKYKKLFAVKSISGKKVAVK